MKLILIRHGEPDYSIDSLTPKGWKEASLLADRLTKMNIRAFYVSPLGRAKDTIHETLIRLGREAEVLPWLQEFRAGILDPSTGDRRIPWNLMPQYWTRQSDMYDKDLWRGNALYKTGQVSEIYDETAAGLDALLERYGYRRNGAMYRCEENGDETIVLVCHLALSMTILSYLLGVSPVVMWHSFFMPTSSVTTLITEERIKGEVYFKCMQVGDTSHLYAGNEPVSHSGLFQEQIGVGKVKESR